MAAAIEKLPASLKTRVSFDPQTRELGVQRPLSRHDRNLMQLAFAKVSGAERVIDRLFLKSNRIHASETPEGEKPPFLVPRLGILRQGELELFGPDHFLDLPWNLAECEPDEFVRKFATGGETMRGEIDVSEKGQMTVAFVGRCMTNWRWRYRNRPGRCPGW